MTLLFAATTAAAPTPEPAPLDVTEREVTASNEKVAMAYAALVRMWSANFGRIEAHFAQPSIVRYRGTVSTACGVLPANNAMYCPSRNIIYYDDVFVARQAKAAAAELGTDGDMAAVGIIAHEIGHAVQIQLGEDSNIPYQNEATADCLAGAFTNRSATDGSLEKGDLNEVFFGLAAAGDPTPQYTGDRRIDSQIAFRAHYLGHGTREQRRANFTVGYKHGASGCLEAFR
ncbi:MAG: neutral zinc metallopeptidase [Gemmatimonadaceae bacterium]|nr:neutral zinc metallopeptidase [Gemmatimonadaceae bacterium]